MATRSQKAKVGAFVVLCLALMTAAIVIIAGLYEDQGDRYWIEFDETVLGLYEGGLVEYLGVPVGKVVTFWVTEDNLAHVDIVIDPEKVTLHEGVEAQLVIYSLATGTMAISLHGGLQTVPRLLPDSQIPAKTSIIGSLSAKATDVTENLASIIEKVNNMLGEIEEGDVDALVMRVMGVLDEGQGFLDEGKTFVNEATHTLTDIRGKANEVIENFTAISADAKELTKKVDKLVTVATVKIEEFEVPELQGQLTKVLDNIAEVSGRIDHTLKQFDALSASTLHEVNNVEYSLRKSLEEISDAFDSVRQLSDQLKKDPSSIIRGKSTTKEPEL